MYEYVYVHMHDLVVFGLLVMNMCMVWTYMMLYYPYMHYVGPKNYMMKVLYWHEWSYLSFLCDVWNLMVCGLMKGLVWMYGVMVLHILFALVDQVWGHEQSLIIMYVKWRHYRCNWMHLRIIVLGCWLKYVYAVLKCYHGTCCLV